MTALFVALGFPLLVAAEDVAISLTTLQGVYFFNQAKNLRVGAGIEFERIDDVRIEWRGQVAAGYGLEDGIECPARYVVVPGVFAVYLNDGGLQAHASTGELGSATYPTPQQFDASRGLGLSFGRSWSFLLDGSCDCEILFWLDSFGFCTLDLLTEPRGRLDSARLVIVGVRIGDFNEDGRVGLDDASVFQRCWGGVGGGLPEPSCASADFNHDGDVDLRDFATFQRVFTADGF